jgi:hypothetical protein
MPLLAPRPLIESLLVRRSIGELASRRLHCVHCRRTPLVGERIYVYETGPRRLGAPAGADRLVCELCLPLRREPPARSELVMPVEHAGSIRISRSPQPSP